jgi:hypothetical protein
MNDWRLLGGHRHRDFVLTILLQCLLAACSGSNVKTPSTDRRAAPQDFNQLLSKYSDQELRTTVSNRRNKALQDNSPSELKHVSDGQIMD